MFKKNIKKVKNKITEMLKKHYPSYEIKEEYITLLNEGQFANAAVFRYNDNVNLDITIKDFSGSPWFVRAVFGRIFVNIEGHSMLKLENNPSVTKNIKFLSPWTLSFDFIQGDALKKFKKGEIPKEFFIQLEKNVIEMHEKNIVHLDLRNLGNIIMGKDNYPYIIDFQSCISTKHLPQKLREILRNVDISGVYKCWKNRCAEPLDEERENFLNEFKRVRKFWVLRGYPLQRMVKLIKRKIGKEK